MSNKTWWGEKFMKALESFINPDRLSRGRAYSKEERLIDYKFCGTEISGKIKGNKNPYWGIYRTPYYRTSIKFAPLKDKKALFAAMENNPLTLSRLFVRELPSSLEEILPRSEKDIETHCSCPDWENPCKHIAGLYIKVSQEIDHNPMMIFMLRGISEEEIKPYFGDTIHGANDTLQDSDSIELEMKNFWGKPHKIPDRKIDVTIPGMLIKKAGINPPFWHKKISFEEVMNEIYTRVKKSFKW